MDNIISKMKYELGDLKYQLMVSKEKNIQLQNEHKKEVEELQNNLIEFDKELNIKRVSNANSKMVFKLEKEVSQLREFIKLQDKKITDMYEEKQKLTNRLYSNEKLQGCRYAFSLIPNDEEGNKFVEQMKLYFNYESYNFVKRGQNLDLKKLDKGETWKTYENGQPLDKSKNIRIYINKKKEGK